MIWQKNSSGIWEAKDAVWLKKMDNEEAFYSRVAKSNDETFSELNRHLYYNSENPPEKIGEQSMDLPDKRFRAL